MFRDAKVYNCINYVQRLIYPPRCLLCGQAGEAGRDLCAGCLSELPWLRQACHRCGAPLHAAGEVCGVCLRHPPPVDLSIIPFRYQAPLDRLILGLKFGRQLAVAPLLGGLLAEAVRQGGQPLPEGLLPVPMHPRRLRERGYNQAHELARVVARQLALPMFPGLVRRQRHTVMQSRLDGRERRRNLRGAFSLGGGELPGHLALIDDVVTTGSTVNELATLLKAAGVQRVELWACARAGH